MSQSTSPAPPGGYADGVTILRNRAVTLEDLPAMTWPDLTEWLLGPATEVEDVIDLFPAVLARLRAVGLQLDRASMHLGTLHPQLIGFAWTWTAQKAALDEVKVARFVLQSDAYKLNPIQQILEKGVPLRCNLRAAEERAPFPLMKSLAQEGYTDYLALPLNAGGYYNAITLATKAEDGFDDGGIAELKRWLRTFGLLMDRHISHRIAANILDTYLGEAAGGKVLAGEIERGTGAPIEAIIWVSDLRGFSDLSDRLEGPAVLALLNAYFECLVTAIEAADGQVLKFVGDGLLAVFPFDPEGRGKAEVAAAAVEAAEAALRALDDLNGSPTPDLAALPGWQPLRCGIALHEGSVFFGNLGAPQRLDFTVIGRAVNEAARVEGLTKELGRPLLITQPVAARLTRPLVSLGAHRLRGVSDSVGLFGV
ncbi:MAG: adenylate/guanylate cyclase domain-containing protein [Pseudomonadota bacterium]